MTSHPSAAVSEVRDMTDLQPARLPKDSRDNASDNSASTLQPTAPAATSHSESDRETEDDALVPSLLSFKAASLPPIETTTARKSNWDDVFSNSTPTPKPPPRLAPMPKSPPSGSTAKPQPPPLTISTQTNTSTPVAILGDQVELLGSKAKSHYASAYSMHNRSVSHSQAHSHHGNNIFTVSSESLFNTNTMGSPPSLGSLSDMGTEGGMGVGSSLDHVMADGSIRPNNAMRSYSNTILSNASPATTRSSFPLHTNNTGNNVAARHPSTQQQQPQLNRHHPQHNNPLLTPSSSQSNFLSNLPSPLTRTNLAAASNIFRDPPAQVHSGLSNWVSSQSTDKSVGNDISETAVQQQQQQDSAESYITNSEEEATAPSNIQQGPPSSQRKIYPGLKNTVGPYKLLHSIGQGSFSEVKIAIDTRTGEHVAIKLMSRAMIQSSDRLGISVRRESDLLKSMQHPNIIGFREVIETSLQMCIVLDYASGGELFEFVADKRALASEQDIQFIFAQIVDAVDYLHQHNIVHRDLKLENVLLEPRTGMPLRPRVKLTDFGLAKVIEEDSPLLTTRCGSEDYAAPEIILAQPYDGREADIWSLGVVLYALLVGFLPFNMRPGMGRKSFLSMIANAEFGFPGEKVSFKRASLLNLRQRSLSTASTASSTSTAASSAFTGTAGVGSAAGTGPAAILLPAATPDTPSVSLAVAPDEATTTMIVPKMRGVNTVSDEAKDLARWLLQTLGSSRPTARQLMNHPWVVAGRNAV